MTTIDTIAKLGEIKRELELASADLQEAQDGITEALRSYERAILQLIEENRQPEEMPLEEMPLFEGTMDKLNNLKIDVRYE